MFACVIIVDQLALRYRWWVMKSFEFFKNALEI